MTDLKYYNSFSQCIIYFVGEKIVFANVFMLGSCFGKSLREQRLCYISFISFALPIEEEFVPNILLSVYSIYIQYWTIKTKKKEGKLSRSSANCRVKHFPEITSDSRRKLIQKFITLLYSDCDSYLHFCVSLHFICPKCLSCH